MKVRDKAIPLVAITLTLAFADLSMASDANYEPGQIIVKFAPKVGEVKVEKRDGVISLNIPSLDRRMRRYGVHQMDRLFPHKKSELGRIYQFEFDRRWDVNAVAGDFARDDNILYAEPRYLHRLCEVPNDSLYLSGLQWYLDQVHALEAWDIVHGDSAVVIGIVDTGVDWNHPDLESNIWINEGEDIDGNGAITGADWNFVDDDSNGYVDDFFGWDFGGAGYADWNPMEVPGPLGSHGTHCAGIVSAVTNNQGGVAGMAWNCSIMAVKVSRDEEDFVRYGFEGIQYAADNGADVISLSWGRTGAPSSLQQEVIDSAFARGIIIVAAAGNDPGTAPPDTCPLYYPARYNHVTAVAATDANDQIPSWSFYGSWVDVLAPGVDIYNTLWDNTYGMRYGTSMACPLVAGVAGLLRSMESGMNSDEFEMRMQTSSDDIDGLNPGYEGWLGGGRLNAYRALHQCVPVILVSLQATGGQGYIALDWATASEIGCRKWGVYRSDKEDGQYAKVGELPGHGSSEATRTYQWVDRQVRAGATQFYKLRQMDFDGTASWSRVVSAAAGSVVPKTHALHQNCPNPFNASTQIRYQIQKAGRVTLKVFNTLGQEVRILVDANQEPGGYSVRWDGRDADGREVASGLYFCRLRVGEFGRTVKMVLVR